MPVFNIAANTWKQPSYYEGKALRANARVNDAQAAMLEKKVSTYEEDRAIEQRLAEQELGIKADKNAIDEYKALTDRREALIKENKQAADAIDAGMAAGEAARNIALESGMSEEEADSFAVNAYAAKLGSMSNMDTAQARQQVLEQTGGKWDSKLANAWLMSADEQRIRSRPGTTINLQNDKGRTRSVQENTPEHRRLIKNGWFRVSPKQQIEQGPPWSFNDPRTNAQKGAAYQDDLDKWNETSGLQEMITSGLPRVLETPMAVGITGKAGVLGSGLLSAVGQEELANNWAEWASGASPEEISQLQTQLQAIRGMISPIVTGQESRARLSDKEQEIGSRAVSIIDEIKGPADLTKAYPQVIGALKQLYEEGWAKKYRIAASSPDFDYPYDLNNKDERVELIQLSLEAGMDDKSIKRMLTRLRAIQK